MIIAMIPARMGSQRLKQKNLRLLNGVPLIVHAIRKAKQAGVFDQIWVNSEHEKFGELALQEEIFFHQRPAHLADNNATSEDFVYDFLTKHPCEYLVQVHSIAPLLTAEEVAGFATTFINSDYDVLLSVVNEQIECVYKEQPVNFTFNKKTNSQELTPIQRLTWCITGWRANTYLKACQAGQCATYSGIIGYYPVSRLSGHVIKTEEDLKLAEAYLSVNNLGIDQA